MNIRKHLITAAVALTMVAMVAPGITSAALTPAQVSAIVSLLQSFGADANTIANVQATLSGSPVTPPPSSSGTPAACVGITFSRNLAVGSTGSDVKCLQAIMNATGHTVATSGAGSPGQETTTFGPKTLVAVQAYQASKGWTPAGQVGPLTRAALNMWLGNPSSNPSPNPVPTGSGLTISLASDTPVASSVPSSAALVPLMKFNVYNGDNVQAKVTSLKLHRIGFSADASLTNVYLFAGANRLTDAAGVSSGLITFNDSTGIVMVDPYTTKTITVYADLSATTGETIGVSLTPSETVATSSSVNGGTVYGNLMTVASATLAGVNFASTTTPSTASVNPQKDFVVWENLTSITTRSVYLKWLRLREIGTISYSDLGNFRLYVDGVMVGTAVPSLDSNGYVTFDMTGSPVTLQTGTRDIKVVADIIGGSNKNFTMSLRVAADVSATDSQYGVNVLAQANSTTFSARTTGTVTINSGTVTVQKATNSPSGTVTNLASNAVLGTFTLQAAGERVKIDTLTAAVISSRSTVGCLRNGALFANGVQIGSTSNLYTTANTTCGTGNPTSTTFNLGSSLIVDPSTPVTLEIRADIYDNDGNNGLVSNDTLQARLNAGSANGTGQVSLVTSNVPAANLTANSLTVKQGSLTLSKYQAYTNQTVVPPQTNYKVGHFTVSNDAIEPINLTSIRVDTTYASTGFTNLYVKYGNNTTSVTANPTSSTTYNVNYQLPAGQTIDVMVYADIASTLNGGGASTPGAAVLVSGTTVNSATAVNTNSGNVLSGQGITYSTGTVNAVVDGSTPLNQVVAGNQSVVTGKFKFTASNDLYTIAEAKFTVQGNNGAVINNATLWDGGVALGTVPFDSANNQFYFTSVGVTVPANTTKVLSISFSLVTPFTDGTVVTTGKNVAVTLAYFKALNGSGVMHDAGSGTLASSDAGTTIAGSTTGTSAANYTYVYKTMPTFTIGSVDVNTQGVNLSAGSTTELYKFTVAAAPQGNVSLRQLKFNLTVSDPNGTDGTFGSFKFFRGSTDLTQAGAVAIKDASSTDLTIAATAGNGSTVVVIFYPEEVIPAGTSYTYSLKATPANFANSSGTADTVSTTLPTDTTPAGVAAGADVTRYYLSSASNTGIQTLFTSANQGGGGTAANVIWSDNSAGGAKPHDASDSSTTSPDWFNGYLIQNTPLDSIGIAAK